MFLAIITFLLSKLLFVKSYIVIAKKGEKNTLELFHANIFHHA